MEKQWYLLIVLADVQPTVHGPYETEQKMECVAKAWRTTHGDGDGLYAMKAVDMPAVWAFPAAMFEPRDKPDGE